MGFNCPTAAVAQSKRIAVWNLFPFVPLLWEVKSASAEVIPELLLELYEALSTLDNG